MIPSLVNFHLYSIAPHTVDCSYSSIGQWLGKAYQVDCAVAYPACSLDCGARLELVPCWGPPPYQQQKYKKKKKKKKSLMAHVKEVLVEKRRELIATTLKGHSKRKKLKPHESPPTT